MNSKGLIILGVIAVVAVAAVVSNGPSLPAVIIRYLLAAVINSGQP